MPPPWSNRTSPGATTGQIMYRMEADHWLLVNLKPTDRPRRCDGRLSMVATPPPSLNICICDFITSFVFRTGIHASELASGEVIVRGRGAGGGGNNAGGRSLPPTGNYWSLGLSRFLGHFSRISRTPSGELSLADPPRRKCIETEVKRELGQIFRTGIGTFSTPIP